MHHPMSAITFGAVDTVSTAAAAIRPVTDADLAQVRAFLCALSPAERLIGFGLAMTDRLMQVYGEMEVRPGMTAVAASLHGETVGVALVMAGAGAIHAARIAFFIRGALDAFASLDALLDDSLKLAAAQADVVTVPIADQDGPLAAALRARGAGFVVAGGVLLATLRVGNDAYRWIDRRPAAAAPAEAEPEAAHAAPFPEIIIRSPVGAIVVAGAPGRRDGETMTRENALAHLAAHHSHVGVVVRRPRTSRAASSLVGAPGAMPVFVAAGRGNAARAHAAAG